jgi:hypothetical protein
MGAYSVYMPAPAFWCWSKGLLIFPWGNMQWIVILPRRIPPTDRPVYRHASTFSGFVGGTQPWRGCGSK